MTLYIDHEPLVEIETPKMCRIITHDYNLDIQ